MRVYEMLNAYPTRRKAEPGLGGMWSRKGIGRNSNDKYCVSKAK